MNKGYKPSVNSFCCFSTVALACRDGTTRGLFIPRVILLTIGKSGTVVGKTSHPCIISNSFFTSSKLPFHAGLSQDFSIVHCHGIQFPERGVGLDGTLAFASQSALQLFPEVEHHQLWVLHFPEEYRVAHSRPQLFLPAPVQRRPI